MTILKIDNLSKNFAGLKALSEVSFSIEKGGVVGLIGPNGAGKTTLFNCVSGLLPSNGGSILFDGVEILGLPPNKIAKKGIGRTFQIVKPFGNMTAIENVMVGSFSVTTDYKEAREKAYQALKMVFLDKQANQVAKTLNLGQRKRLEVAKAIATEPKLLLLDEVMAGLTTTEVKEIIEVIRNINNSGVSILLIEHIMDAVMSLSKHIVVLNFGRLIAEGTPAEIRNNQQVIEAYFGVEE